MPATSRFPSSVAHPRAALLAAVVVTALVTVVTTALGGLALTPPHSAGASTPGGAGTHLAVPAGATAPAVALVPSGDGHGYLVITTAGDVLPSGDATAHGSLTGVALARPIVGAAAAPGRTGGGDGYWLVAADGGIFAFGTAGFFGSMGGQHLNMPIVGMAATASGQGYWLVASDGGIFAFGDAGFSGSMGGTPLNQPVVGMTASATGRGYWLVASDGGIFAFGDAGFYGSTGNLVLNQPIEAMAATPGTPAGAGGGHGYWLVASDGGIFAFGDAGFYGSLGGQSVPAPIRAMAPSAPGTGGAGGYWLVGSSGTVYAFGTAGHYDQGTSGPTTLHVTVLGDSLSTQAAASFLGDMGGVTTATVSTTYASFPGTAPCDWFTAESGRPTVAQLAAARPDVAVIEFAGNSGMPCIAAANATPTGVATQYTRDLTTTIAAFLAAGTAHVLVVGAPTIAPSAVFDPEAISGLIKATEHALVATLANPAVTFVDAGAAVEGPGGSFTATLPCTSGELFFQLCAGPVVAGVTQETVRAGDGIHLCDPNMFFLCTGYSSGAARFAGAEARAVDQLYGLAPLPLV